MMQKLEVSSICKLKLPTPVMSCSDELRFFIKDYNEAERSYTAVCLDHRVMGRAIVIREKAIVKIIATALAPPDLSKWSPPDALAYLTYELNGIERVVNGERRNTSRGYAYWENYKDHLSAFKKDPNRLKLALLARKQYFDSRLVPSHGSKKSRTVMRRLRKKNRMRNDNSSVSKNRQKTYYSVPTEAINSTTEVIPGVSTKNTGKKKAKLVAVKGNATIRGKSKNPVENLSSVSKAVQDFVSMVNEHDISPWAIAVPKEKKKVKKKKLDIPF